jgi:choline dehydrogenase-like flavoprotein
MIPNADCRCEIDPNTKDRWGIPVLRFRWKWGMQEIAQMHHASVTMRDMILAMGGTPTTTETSGGQRAQAGATLTHESGTACMGASAKGSVLNADGHAWDVRNLYIADGASFAGHADKNPTHTIMALAWRASDHLAESLVRKEI